MYLCLSVSKYAQIYTHIQTHEIHEKERKRENRSIAYPWALNWLIQSNNNGIDSERISIITTAWINKFYGPLCIDYIQTLKHFMEGTDSYSLGIKLLWILRHDWLHLQIVPPCLTLPTFLKYCSLGKSSLRADIEHLFPFFLLTPWWGKTLNNVKVNSHSTLSILFSCWLWLFCHLNVYWIY